MTDETYTKIVKLRNRYHLASNVLMFPVFPLYFAAIGIGWVFELYAKGVLFVVGVFEEAHVGRVVKEND